MTELEGSFADAQGYDADLFWDTNGDVGVSIQSILS